LSPALALSSSDSDISKYIVLEDNPMTAEELLAQEEDAYCLMEAAVMLDQARSGKDAAEESTLEAALSNNLDLWVAIRATISQPANSLPGDVKENLVRLSKYVVSTTRNQGGAITQHALTTLININLQISEGLLEGGEKYD
jgi:flagellar biosynthesis regulator FlaF